MKKFFMVLISIVLILGISLGTAYAVKPDLVKTWFGIEDTQTEEPTDDTEKPDDGNLGDVEIPLPGGDDGEIEVPIDPGEQEIVYTTNVADYEINGDTITAYNGTDKNIKIPTSYSIAGTKIVELSFDLQHDLINYLMDNHDSITYPITIKDNTNQEYEFYSEFEVIEDMDMVYPVSMSTEKMLYEDGDDYQITKIDMDILSNSLVEYVIVPDGITEVDASFRRCDTLKEVQIPATVTEIGMQTFLDCENLVAIKVDEDSENYLSEDGVLFNKDKTILECFPAGKGGSYTIPNTVTEIETLAFYYCERLENVYFENGINLDTIPSQCFSNCTSLKSIEIPASVKTLASSSFYGCASLETVNFVEGSLLESFGTGVFDRCGTLKSINLYLLKNLKSIGNNVFQNCSSLESLIIPASVTSIGYSSFNSSSIKSITFNSTTPPGEIGVISPFSSSIENIYVPAEAVESYKSTWTQYADIIKAIPEVSIGDEETGDIVEL